MYEIILLKSTFWITASEGCFFVVENMKIWIDKGTDLKNRNTSSGCVFSGKYSEVKNDSDERKKKDIQRYNRNK